MAAAYELGMRHVDHFWSAMSSVPGLRERFGTPMQASMLEFVLATAHRAALTSDRSALAALLAATFVMNRRGNKAMYGMLEGQTGAAGAALVVDHQLAAGLFGEDAVSVQRSPCRTAKAIALCSRTICSAYSCL